MTTISPTTDKHNAMTISIHSPTLEPEPKQSKGIVPLCDNPTSLPQHLGAFDFSSTPQAREKQKEVIAMAPELNWTSIAETFIKSLFGYLSKKRKSRRSNGDNASK